MVAASAAGIPPVPIWKKATIRISRPSVQVRGEAKLRLRKASFAGPRSLNGCRAAPHSGFA